jgi:hypothetical protein
LGEGRKDPAKSLNYSRVVTRKLHILNLGDATPFTQYTAVVPPPLRVTQSPFWTSLQQLRSLLRGLMPEFVAQQEEIVTRSRETVDYIAELLENSSGSLVSDNALMNGQSWASVMITELQSAINLNSPGSIANGSQYFNHLDALSQNLHTFPAARPTPTLNAAVEEAQTRLKSVQDLQIQHEAETRAATDNMQRLLAEAEKIKADGKKRLDQQEQAASNLLAALGAAGTSAGYRETASSESDQANWWRWVTIGGGLATAAVAAALLIIFHDDKVTDTLTRLSVTLPLILLTVYAGKQSADHRNEARRAKHLELSFASVDAYLADLEPSDRASLKSQLSSQLFAEDTTGGGAAGYPSSADLLDVMKELAKRAR